MKTAYTGVNYKQYEMACGHRNTGFMKINGVNVVICSRCLNSEVKFKKADDRQFSLKMLFNTSFTQL